MAVAAAAVIRPQLVVTTKRWQGGGKWWSGGITATTGGGSCGSATSIGLQTNELQEETKKGNSRITAGGGSWRVVVVPQPVVIAGGAKFRQVKRWQAEL